MRGSRGVYHLLQYCTGYSCRSVSFIPRSQSEKKLRLRCETDSFTPCASPVPLQTTQQVTTHVTAPPAPAEPAAPADIAPSASCKRKQTGVAKRVAKSRAAAPKAPDRRRLAAAALKVPTNLGATAAGRYTRRLRAREEAMRRLSDWRGITASRLGST